MTDIFPLAAIPILIVMYCLFVVAMADNGVEAAQRWVCVFDDSRPFCGGLVGGPDGSGDRTLPDG